MKRAVLALLSFGLIGTATASEERGDAFAEAAQSRIKEQSNVRGDDPEWFFLTKELRHVATGKFWEKPWEEVAKNETDPVPSIVEFANQLASQDVRLVVVPVPPKAVIYPDKLDSDFQPGDAHSAFPFLERLLEAGVNVIDLESEFLAAREEGDDIQWYCKQDAHFSPAAIERIADLILRNQGMDAVEESSVTQGEPEELVIVGDQIVGSEWEGTVAPEKLRIRPVFHKGNRGVEPEGNTLVLGDSHSLVFHQGKENGMHCTGAGIVDQLSQRMGTSVNLIGVRGSGLVQARKQAFFHASETPGFWAEMKLVVWIFSAREFTQSRDRIVPIPLSR
jgi:alginate O-acetyltransferase complex protein AlgJ